MEGLGLGIPKDPAQNISRGLGHGLLNFQSKPHYDGNFKPSQFNLNLFSIFEASR